MNNDFFEAIKMIETEKGIPGDVLLEKIKTAVSLAVKKDYGGVERINIDTDETKGKFNVYILKTVVEEITDRANEILIDEALKYTKKPTIGSVVEIKLETKQLGRIAAQAAKHVIRQGIREAERGKLLEQFNNKMNEVISAVIQKIDPINGNVTLEVDKIEIVLFKNDQIPGEAFSEGDYVKVYVSDVIATEKRYGLKVTRTHRNLVKRLFETEVPEIFDGTVEIKSISREAGSRTKIAVYSKDDNVDPIGACIGPKGSRVSQIVSQINGEKIDVVKYSEDPAEFISAALSPSGVVKVIITNPEERTAKVVVPDHQLSLAIGNKGQNAKLAARLTGYKIDICPESGFVEDEDLPAEDLPDIDSEAETVGFKVKESEEIEEIFETEEEALE